MKYALLFLLMLCMCTAFAADSDDDLVLRALAGYESDELKRGFVQRHPLQASFYLREMLYGRIDNRGLTAAQQLHILYRINPQHCLNDLIFASRTLEHVKDQILAIELMGKLGDERCVDFLYDFLKPNDLRTVAAIHVLRKMKKTDFDRIAALLTVPPAAYLKNEIGQPDRSIKYSQIIFEVTDALTWSGDKKYIELLTAFDEKPENADVSAYVRGAISRLHIYFSEDSDEKLKKLYALDVGFNEWVRGVWVRQGRSLDELPAPGK